MAFVYIHIVWFACWIGFGVEKYPYGLLTMIVSLEAMMTAGLAEDDAVAGDVEGEILAGVDHLTGGPVEVDGRGAVGGERVPGA